MTAALTPFYEGTGVTIYQADSREAWQHLPEHSIDALVTSPPYFNLRDYKADGQLGMEDDPADYVTALADLLTAYGARVLRPEGSLWLNLGDTYSSKADAGSTVGPTFRQDRANVLPARVNTTRMAPYKSLLMLPERVALALIDRGWILRNRVVWAKKNGMPQSVTDRLANRHEALFHFVRQPKYHYDLDAIREPHAESSFKRVGQNNGNPVFNGNKQRGRATGADTLDPNQFVHPLGKNPGDVWAVATQPYPGTHFAVFPPELIRRPILATVPEGGTVLDPFAGTGTTGVMARRLGRKSILIDLNPDYCRMAASRFAQEVLPL